MVVVPFPFDFSSRPRGFADPDRAGHHPAIYAPPATESAIEGRNFATLSPILSVSGAAPQKTWRVYDIRRCVSGRLDQSELFAGAALLTQPGYACDGLPEPPARRAGRPPRPVPRRRLTRRIPCIRQGFQDTPGGVASVAAVSVTGGANGWLLTRGL